MRRKTWLEAAALAFALAAPAGAQSVDTILVEPSYPTSKDRVEITVLGTETPICPITWEPPRIDMVNRTVLLRVKIPDCISGPPGESEFRRRAILDPLPAGTYWIDYDYTFLSYNGKDTIHPSAPVEILEVREPNPSLLLGQDDEFLVSVEWRNQRDGSHGLGYAKRYAKDSGAFWFFSSSNLEVTVKILDGRAVNGHWWVFIANMTDLEVNVKVEQGGQICLVGAGPLPCPTKTYTQAAGTTRNVIDVNAFAD